VQWRVVGAVESVAALALVAETAATIPGSDQSLGRWGKKVVMLSCLIWGER
jgi:hypothetical protein